MTNTIPHSLTALQKSALITTGAAAAFKILLWSLGLSLHSTGPLAWDVDILAVVRVIFALLSFVAFDLVLVSVVIDARTHGFAWPGALAALGAAVVSGMIALQVADVYDLPALHVGPAVTMLLYAAHLMLGPQSNQGDGIAMPQPEQVVPQPMPLIEQHFHVPPQPLQLPRTVSEFIAARAAELPDLSPPRLATELGTSPDTIRRALSRSDVLEN
jgi:hypothetical protein